VGGNTAGGMCECGGGVGSDGRGEGWEEGGESGVLDGVCTKAVPLSLDGYEGLGHQPLFMSYS
jgi:hypothetical protein